METRSFRLLSGLLCCCLACCLVWTLPLSLHAQDRPQPQDNRQARPAQGAKPQPGTRPAAGAKPGGGNAAQPQQPAARPQPVRPAPAHTRPVQAQPARPQPQPGRPQPGTKPPAHRPPANRPVHGRPPQWGRPPANRPSYGFRPSDRDRLRRYYAARIRAINRARRPLFTVGGYYPYADIGYLQPVPPDVYGYLPPPPPGYQMGYYDGYVVVYDPITYFIANLIDLLQ
ncbi:MAG: hypothetical protein QOE55_2934 [Acidobacteriaceae bacterium]|jgi:hypothetical protein|nr:hypothetical protein [Acidobacteriaceae bacterium]MDX6459237.1 hypothetical protein [Acidobacteriaceae bacterium]